MSLFSVRHRVQTPGVFRRDEGGASAVEFALILPVFMLIVVGVLCYGFYYATVHSVQSLTAEAARASVEGLTFEERAMLARARVSDMLPNYTLIDPAKLNVIPEVNGRDPNLLNVRVRYDASSLSIWAFEDFIPLPDKVIMRTVVVRRGGY